MKKSKMKSMNGFKQFVPGKTAGSAKYRKQIIKGPVKAKLTGGGAKYGGA